MKHRALHPFAALLMALAAAGCGRLAAGPPPMPASESERFGAALAHITVVNGTQHRLVIAYRPASGPGGEVGMGVVDAGGRRRLAPVPAGEAIRITARAAGIGQLDLDARSFDLGEEWVWEIPPDAPFRDPPVR